mmetsp:Transcript_27127/g.75824  ORF Transcript_27127/g.75824 Transcript_27127/m.75824 type:complete len:293 (-) Transcript_27127:189-1067(-)
MRLKSGSSCASQCSFPSRLPTSRSCASSSSRTLSLKQFFTNVISLGRMPWISAHLEQNTIPSGTEINSGPGALQSPQRLLSGCNKYWRALLGVTDRRNSEDDDLSIFFLFSSSDSSKSESSESASSPRFRLVMRCRCCRRSARTFLSDTSFPRWICKGREDEKEECSPSEEGTCVDKRALVRFPPATSLPLSSDRSIATPRRASTHSLKSLLESAKITYTRSPSTRGLILKANGRPTSVVLSSRISHPLRSMIPRGFPATWAASLKYTKCPDGSNWNQRFRHVLRTSPRFVR